MSKLRVHDMAGEFGVSAEEVIVLLRQMDVPVRSHMSLLTDDQVSRIRARWEREKRQRAERAQPPAPAAGGRRRRTTAGAESTETPVAEAAPAIPAVRRRRGAAKPPAASAVTEETQASATPAQADAAESGEVAAAARTVRRRQAVPAPQAETASEAAVSSHKIHEGARPAKPEASRVAHTVPVAQPPAAASSDSKAPLSPMGSTPATAKTPDPVPASAHGSTESKGIDTAVSESKAAPSVPNATDPQARPQTAAASDAEAGSASRAAHPAGLPAKVTASAATHTSSSTSSTAGAAEKATAFAAAVGQPGESTPGASTPAAIDAATKRQDSSVVTPAAAPSTPDVSQAPVLAAPPASSPSASEAESQVSAADAAATAAIAASLPADRPKPRPVVPGAPRLRPVASASPNMGQARPVASAVPGGGLQQGHRRDDRRPQQPAAGGSVTAQPGAGQHRRGKRGKRGAVDQEAVSANITKTMTAMRGAPHRGRAGRRFGAEQRAEREEQRAAAIERERKTVHVNEFITVSELAQILSVSATEIVGFAFKTLGLMVTINQRLDFDQIELIAGEFGFHAVKESEYQADLPEEDEVDREEDLKPRPPVVTIMGHVDHGKTSLLDYIRRANVASGESGGITQHIGAYHVKVAGGRQITFLDTPGHEAFTAMRARGAQVTDIVVIVVAADDQVMPQTVEAISHARNAGVPIIIAINKIDLPSANVLKVKQELLQHEVVLEEFGGTVLASEISAKKGTGVDGLLEQILLQADILELRANPSRRASGAVVEAQLDQGKGPVATVLVQNGTLKVGDDFICGIFSGRVRAMLDERGKNVKSAGPAMPVQILGLTGVPMAGDHLLVVDDATAARDIAQRRERLDREAKSRRTARGIVSLDDFMNQAQAGEARQLRLLIKADQGGPAEALADALGQLSNQEVQVDIIHRGVGAIAESDILLAKASGAIIIGFHVRPDNNARAAAEREGVEIKLYRIIYDAVADVKAALEGLLRPEEREVVFGEAQVRDTFKVARVGTIAGCMVRSGVINRRGRVRVIRDGVEIYDGSIASLRRFKDDVTEVKEGYECGIGIEHFNDIKVGDVFECYRTEEVARTLDQAGKS